MSQPKTLILIVVLIIIVVLILIIQISRDNTPSQAPQPFPSPIIQIEETKIINTNLSDQPIEITDVVKIKFDRPLDNESLALSISPEEAIIPLFDPTLTELTIKPSSTWQFNTSYTINILKTTKSQDGKFLDKDYPFLFTTKPYSGI